MFFELLSLTSTVRGRKFSGTFVLRNFRSTDFRSLERNLPHGTFAPRSECAEERKVLLPSDADKNLYKFGACRANFKCSRWALLDNHSWRRTCDICSHGRLPYVRHLQLLFIFDVTHDNKQRKFRHCGKSHRHVVTTAGTRLTVACISGIVFDYFTRVGNRRAINQSINLRLIMAWQDATLQLQVLYKYPARFCTWLRVFRNRRL